MTNYERIKAMSVEEIATLVRGYCYSEMSDTAHTCAECLFAAHCLYDTSCRGWVEWLLSESEVDT